MDYHHRWEHTLRRIEIMEKIFIVGMHGDCLGGENIDGNQARRIGLVDHLVAGEAFFEQIDCVGARYVQACSVGTRLSKLLVNRAADHGFEAFLSDYEALQKRAQHSLDAISAGRAYRDGSQPEWQ
jgi:enoyl-CoA hydratase